MKFNKEAFNKRGIDQYEATLTKITSEWEAGNPYVELEVDTDVFKSVRGALKLVDDVAMVSVGPKNALSRQKGSKTLFKVVHKSILL